MVLLTGGTGFLGRRVAAALTDKGYEPVRLVRGGRRPEHPEDLEIIGGNVRDVPPYHNDYERTKALADGYRLRSLEEGIGAAVDGLLASESA